MSNLPSFYTQAGNFRNDVEGSVDPRTGMFNVSIKLGEIVGNNNLGPTLPIALSYSPLATLNGPTTTVFGEGVSLNMTQYDTSQTPCRLSLSTGEQYIVDDEALKILQNKLDHVRISKDSSGDYVLTYRSGIVETLYGPNDNSYSYAVKMPKRLVDHLGRGLVFHWDTDQLIPALSSIADDNNVTLLSVDYSPSEGPLFTFYPGQPETYTVQLGLDNGSLQTITNLSLGASNPLTWTLSYDQIGNSGYWGSWVTGVATPGQSANSSTESVQYADDGTGAAFPNPSTPVLPQVSTYTRNPGCNQPLLVSGYTYDIGGSFLGGNTDGGSDGSSDALYGVFDDYVYGSTETRTAGGVSVTTSRTYNRYHLLTDEIVTQNKNVRSVHTDYEHLQKGLDFESQASNCQCPTKKTTTWTASGKNQQKVVVTAYDQCGNLTQSAQYSDTACENQCAPTTNWEFYVGDGSASEQGSCPKDPLGFQSRFVKRVTTTPCPTAYLDTPSLTTVYTYTEIS